MCSILNKHEEVGELISTIITIIKIAVPIVLVIMGMLDFAKASTKANADDIAKAKNIFIQRAIAGILVFFVTSIVQFAVTLAADVTGNNSVWDCVDKLINSK